MKQKKSNKRKHKYYFNGYPLEDYLPILIFFSVICAIGILLSAVKDVNWWVKGSAIYLMVLFFIDHSGNISDIQTKDNEIAELKQKIKKLESTMKE